MDTQGDDPKLSKLKKALKNVYSADVSMDKTYKKNLDKLVENTIKSQKLDKHAQTLEAKNAPRKKGFLSLFFKGAKWQAAFLTSFVAVFLVGSIAFAAVPDLREIIIPTKGDIYINSEPENASVLLKGVEYIEFQEIGKTPLRTKIKAGKYEMKLVLKDFEEYTTTFNLEAGKSFSQEVRLKEIVKALEKIKEWKTYTDLENGFEFTYPLSWELRLLNETSDYVDIEAVGENSKVKFYTHDLESDIDMELITIDEKDYTGIKGVEGEDLWKYTVFTQEESADRSNLIKYAFYTNTEEEFEIFDFIESTIKVYDQEKEPEEEIDWTTYTHTTLGFGFSYPLDWVVVEKEKSEYFARYEVRPIENGTEPLQIIYSKGYLEEFNDYLFDQTVWINGLEVDQYHSGTCDGKFLYEFPNRIYLIFQASESNEINNIYAKILDSMIVFLENNYQTISNYTWDYSVTIPNEWKYEVVSDETIFDGTSHVQLSNSFGIIRILPWSEVEDLWDWFLGDIDFTDVNFRTGQVKIEGRDYTRYEIWLGTNNLMYIVYTQTTPDQEPNHKDSKVTIGDSDFVVIFEGQMLTSSDDTITQADQDKILLIDAIVASLQGIEE